jgi:beta-lactamase superfamily II metal-dependent hydrolase
MIRSAPGRIALRCGLAAAMLAMLPATVACAAATASLQIYFIDVEGGQSTLVVTPERETLLIDAGFAGEGGFTSVPGEPSRARDPGRIFAAMRDAGVERIDYLLVTHFHRDHIGGVPEIAQRVPVGTYIDHGSAYPPEQRARPEGLDLLDVAAYDRYVQARARGRHLQPKPGDRLPLKGVDAVVVSADRATLARPLPDAGEANPTCRPSPLTPADPMDENQRSTGIVMRFGSFRFLDLGDLNGQPLYDLVCPVDRIGVVDVYLVAHHGNSTVADPATFGAFRPRAAVVNNAPRKGGRLALLKLLRGTPGIDTWQLHVSGEAGEDNAPPEHIANLDDASAHWLKVTASADGSFTLGNARTGAAKSYPARQVRHSLLTPSAVKPATSPQNAEPNP